MLPNLMQVTFYKWISYSISWHTSYRMCLKIWNVNESEDGCKKEETLKRNCLLFYFFALLGFIFTFIILLQNIEKYLITENIQQTRKIIQRKKHLHSNLYLCGAMSKEKENNMKIWFNIIIKIEDVNFLP